METKWEIMRRTSIENIDEIIANLVYELSENYFGHVNYAVHFNATPIQLKNEPLNIKELLKPYITITNELNCRKYELERINIQHAKALLKK